MRQLQKGGPDVNSEYYSGWASYWNQPRTHTNITVLLKGLNYFLSLNASFNFFMFHGGTNFGLTTGANYYEDIVPEFYSPTLTSNDYDAPLDEAGDPTEKYFAIKQALKTAVI